MVNTKLRNKKLRIFDKELTRVSEVKLFSLENEAEDIHSKQEISKQRKVARGESELAV